MVLERPVFLCIGLAATCWSQCIIAESLGAVEIRKLPPIGKTIDAFPRIARGASPAAIMRINRILERADDSLRSKQARCARDTPEGSIERTVDVTMVGPSVLTQTFTSFMHNRLCASCADLIRASGHHPSRKCLGTRVKPAYHGIETGLHNENWYLALRHDEWCK